MTIAKSNGIPNDTDSVVVKIWQRVPSKALIFTQKTRPRNLGDPKAIAFAKAENRPDLPTDEEF